MTKEQLFQARLALVSVKAGLFVSFCGGGRIAQETAALNARFYFERGGSAANAICAGVRFGRSLMKKQLINKTGY